MSVSVSVVAPDSRLQKGTILELRDPSFDPQLLLPGDRGVVTRSWSPEKDGAFVHMYPILPTCGILPLYNTITPQHLEDGVFEVVEGFSASRLQGYRHQRVSWLVDHQRARGLFNGDFDMRTPKGQQGFDERLFDLLRHFGGLRVDDIGKYFGEGRDRELSSLCIQESMDRLHQKGRVTFKVEFRTTYVFLANQEERIR